MQWRNLVPQSSYAIQFVIISRVHKIIQPVMSLQLIFGPSVGQLAAYRFLAFLGSLWNDDCLCKQILDFLTAPAHDYIYSEMYKENVSVFLHS